MTFTRTRFAPTPSGYLHTGNILSFAYTSALALRTGAEILLRIDDVDRERTETIYIDDIFKTLRFLGIEWNIGPKDTTDFGQKYSQQIRQPIYSAMLAQLAAGDHVFACTCSRKDVFTINKDGKYPGTCRHLRLPLDTPGAAWRLKTDNTSVKMHTLQGIEKHTLPENMQFFVVRKRDGLPAYQLASVADDLHFGVDLIVRGADLLPSTIAQLCLARVLNEQNFLDATFFHHPLVTDENGIKLSKSEGATSIYHLRNAGRTANQLIHHISFLFSVGACSNWQELAKETAYKYFHLL